MTDLLNTFKHGLEEIIPENILTSLLSGKKKRIVKWGADPSAPDLHLGHLVILNKLKCLQDMGHTIVFLIGDFTALIGDPSGKSETRPVLTQEDVQANTLTYEKQIFKKLDPKKTVVQHNSKWLSTLSSTEIMKIMSTYNVARMLEREDFKNRYSKGVSIGLHEFLYPLLQGYDSVILKNDIEIGGTDQKFNLLVGRHLQSVYGIT
ncbi:MAG: tyrosine--tRNA ligase, partial [Candidatus Margulisbacteria bacterium]|nr:tyrosine--tRNA ligase [Candidatus Margulisiibacteriota bacterium]